MLLRLAGFAVPGLAARRRLVHWAGKSRRVLAAFRSAAAGRGLNWLAVPLKNKGGEPLTLTVVRALLKGGSLAEYKPPGFLGLGFLKGWPKKPAAKRAKQGKPPAGCRRGCRPAAQNNSGVLGQRHFCAAAAFFALGLAAKLANCRRAFARPAAVAAGCERCVVILQ